MDTLAEKGWSDKDSGELLDLAEREGYEILATTDQNLRHQQNPAGRQIGIVVLLATAWPEVRLRTREILITYQAHPGTGGFPGARDFQEHDFLGARASSPRRAAPLRLRG